MNVFRFNSGDLLLPNSGSFPSLKKAIAVKYVSTIPNFIRLAGLQLCQLGNKFESFGEKEP